MIKVQPAASRVVKSETADTLTLTYPPQGILSVGGLMVGIGVAWIVGAALGTLQVGAPDWRIAIVVSTFPALVILLWGLFLASDSWSISRSAEQVTFRRRGKVRSWPAQDVTSLWVDEIHHAQDRPRYVLIIGFRNGRSEDVLSGPLGEDFRWVAALLKEPKGERKPASATARAAAEPVPRRSDPSVVPAAIASRKYESGVEVTFLPLIDFKQRWWKLLGWGLAGLALLLGASQLLVWALGKSYPLWITRVSVGIWLLILLGRMLLLKQSTVIRVLDGVVSIGENFNRGQYQFPVESVEFIQTFKVSDAAELQFLLKGRAKVRLLHGRPAEELEWAARFLRLALKGHADPVPATVKVDAAGGACQVCGDKMESRVIFCQKCRTPHHEECWSYVGMCSTYGCREIGFTRT